MQSDSDRNAYFRRPDSFDGLKKSGSSFQPKTKSFCSSFYGPYLCFPLLCFVEDGMIPTIHNVQERRRRHTAEHVHQQINHDVFPVDQDAEN